MQQAVFITDGVHRAVQFPAGMALRCGAHLAPLQLAFSTYGALSPQRDNAILICHALTGDQYVAEPNPLTRKPGWWENFVGPGRAIDTNRFFVICSNVLGGCMGSSGPASINPATGAYWGTDFPPITIADMVSAQALLVEALGVEKLFAVVGGSMGGMQALQWAVSFPGRAHAVVAIATSPFFSTQNIAFNEVSRQAITADPDWHNGRYRQHGTIPARGLSVARMMAHITYMSEEALTRKFGRRLQVEGLTDGAAAASLFGSLFQVESYLRHQGSSFVRRFDANSYLAITRAMDQFDLAAEHGGQLSHAFENSPARFCLVSFSSDWLFPTSQTRMLTQALNHVAANVSFVEIRSDKGHDAFLLDEPDMDKMVRGFLHGAARRIKMTGV